MGADTVCLSDTNSESCVNNFQFFMIDSETGLNQVDGILGLSPAVDANGPSYMEALHSQGQIDEYKVSFQLNNDYQTTTNYADFGTPVASRYAGEQWHSKLVKKDDTWWTLRVNGLQLGSSDIMSGVMSYGIIDTGTSLMYLPPSDYINLE